MRRSRAFSRSSAAARRSAAASAVASFACAASAAFSSCRADSPSRARAALPVRFIFFASVFARSSSHSAMRRRAMSAFSPAGARNVNSRKLQYAPRASLRSCCSDASRKRALRLPGADLSTSSSSRTALSRLPALYEVIAFW